MSKKLLDYDPLTGIKTYHQYDHGTGLTHIEEVQDCSSILERNKRLQNDTSYSYNGKKVDWFHFATVPNTVLYKFMTDYGLDYRNEDDLKKIERLLQSREYMYLRTTDKI